MFSIHSKSVKTGFARNQTIFFIFSEISAYSSGSKVIKLFSCSTQLGIKFITLILNYILTIKSQQLFDILTFNSRINTFKAIILEGDAFTRKYPVRVKVTWNVAQYPLHHVTYSASLLKLLGVESRYYELLSSTLYIM